MTKNSKDRPEPTDVILEVEAGAEILMHMYDAWKKGRPVVPPSDPLSFVVNDSTTSASGHTLILVCSNLGAHGVYLEKVIAHDPADINVVVSRHDSDGWDFGSQDPSRLRPECLPIRVSSGDELMLHVHLSLLSADRLKKKPFGELSVSYTVLGVAKSGLKKQVEFCVRPFAT